MSRLKSRGRQRRPVRLPESGGQGVREIPTGVSRAEAEGFAVAHSLREARERLRSGRRTGTIDGQEGALHVHGIDLASEGRGNAEMARWRTWKAWVLPLRSLRASIQST